MTRSIRGLSVAAAVAFGVSLAAQTPTSTTTPQGTTVADKAGHEVTISGCVAKAADGRFMLTNAMVEPMSTTTTGAPVTPSGSTTTDATTPPPATTATSGAAPASMTWMLAGGSDLEKHLGHKIQVMGRTTWDASMAPRSTPDATTTAGTSGTTMPAPTATTTGEAAMASRPSVDLRTIKMLSPSCP